MNKNKLQSALNVFNEYRDYATRILCSAVTSDTIDLRTVDNAVSAIHTFSDKIDLLEWILSDDEGLPLGARQQEELQELREAYAYDEDHGAYPID